MLPNRRRVDIHISCELVDCPMPRIVAVTGLKGGSGKSTLAVTLAAALAGPQTIRLLDVDPQASAAEWSAGGKLPIACEALPLEDQRHAAAWIRRVRAS